MNRRRIVSVLNHARQVLEACEVGPNDGGRIRIRIKWLIKAIELEAEERRAYPQEEAMRRRGPRLYALPIILAGAERVVREGHATITISHELCAELLADDARLQRYLSNNSARSGCASPARSARRGRSA